MHVFDNPGIWHPSVQRGVMASATESGRSRPDNVADLLRSAAGNYPDRPAVIYGGGERTWADLDRAVDVGARALVASGLQVGDRVIVSLPTGPEIIAAMFAVARAGLVAVPVGPHADLPGIAEKVGARAGLTDSTEPALDVLWSAAELRSWWDGAAEPASAATGGEDIAVLARAASGARAVMVSHRAILAAVAAIGAAPGVRLRSDDRAVAVLPTYHLAGWVTAVLPLCAVGAASVTPDPPSVNTSWVQAVLATIRRHRVTVVPGAPSLYRRLRGAAGVERALTSVRLMTSGAAPLDGGDSSAIRAATGQPVWEGYGLSESASVVTSGLMTRAARAGSVGLPLPGLHLRIVGDDGVDLYPVEAGGQDVAGTDRRDVAADAGGGGEVGRIQIGGPTLFSGYWPDGGGGVGEDGWFATGDLGYFDDMGELHLVDRAAETIRIAGFTVYPREIEDVLAHHPYVRDAAVIGAPGKAGDAVVAVLVAMRGTHPTVEDLDEFVAQRLPVFKRPQHYELVDRLPRNEIGRIDRDAVRARYRASVPAPLLAAPDARPESPSDYRAGQTAAAARDEPGSSAGPGPITADEGHAGEAGGGSAGEEAGKASPDPAGPTGAMATDPPDITPPEPAPDITPEPAPDITPEPAAPLAQLGNRLPGTGQRDRRADDDTDDDLF